jgi:DNA polymerase III subunit gamma/tau
MSYQALARKWRPRLFSDLVGQEHVLRALVHALDNDRLHHAYLFTGTRGVGKTTIARILAKALNCETGVSSTPCGECSACRDIDDGRFVDLIEVDAASRTKIEDTRDLLDNVQYSPARGRYKVYLIDEVHMLSRHSFNALLKTLEEPPPHVKFLLATTDPQNLPVTVLSRCLQFNLKRLPLGMIRERLHGRGAESLVRGPGARAAGAGRGRQPARCAQPARPGGFAWRRPAGEQEVAEMLGTVDREHAVRLLEAVVAGDGPRLLAEMATLDERVPDYDDVLGYARRAGAARCGVAGGARPGRRRGRITPRAPGRWPTALRRRTCSCGTRSRWPGGATCRWRPRRAPVARWCCCACWRSASRAGEFASRLRHPPSPRHPGPYSQDPCVPPSAGTWRGR